MSEKKIVFHIPFNNLNIFERKAQVLTKEWIEARLGIFMNYTLKSLMNQSSQEFMAFVRYDPLSESIVRESLAEYPTLPENIVFVRNEDYEKRVYEYIQGSEFFYEIELASDDLYHRDFVKTMISYRPKPETVILVCQEGYIYSSVTHELAEYFNFSSCFNCWIYRTEEYLKGKRMAYNGWMGAIDLNHEIILWRAYINHCHQGNVCFNYLEEKNATGEPQKRLMGKEFKTEYEKEQILQEFGL